MDILINLACHLQKCTVLSLSLAKVQCYILVTCKSALYYPCRLKKRNVISLSRAKVQCYIPNGCRTIIDNKGRKKGRTWKIKAVVFTPKWSILDLWESGSSCTMRKAGSDTCAMNLSSGRVTMRISDFTITSTSHCPALNSWQASTERNPCSPCTRPPSSRTYLCPH